MNKHKTLELLNKLANQLDDIGRSAEANFVDQMITKLAQEKLTPIGKPYKVGDKFYQKFDAGSKGLIVKEVNADGSLKGAPVPVPTSEENPKSIAQPEDSWSVWFRKQFPGLLPALESKPEEAIKEQQENLATDKPKLDVEQLIKEIQERYNKLRSTGWKPPLRTAEVVEYEEPDEEETDLILSEDPDDIPTRVDLLDNVDFKNKPDFTGESDWADVSMWQNGKPLDNRF